MLTKEDFKEITKIVREEVSIAVEQSERRLLKLITELHLENKERIDRIEARLDRIEDRLDAIELRLDSIEERLDKLEIGQTEIKNSFNEYRNFNDKRVNTAHIILDQHEDILQAIRAVKLVQG